MHKFIAPIDARRDETVTRPAARLDFYRGVATRFEAGTRHVLSRLRQLQDSEGLSEKNRAALAEYIAHYEVSITRWERRRVGLDRRARWWG
jgi:hypothetical protein